MQFWCLTKCYSLAPLGTRSILPISPFFSHCSLCWCQEFRGHFRATFGGQKLSGLSEARCRH